MKVAYVISTQCHSVSYKPGRMVLPKPEEDTHGVGAVGMFFFEHNACVLQQRNPIGERLAAVDCFPKLYGALSGNTPDQLITL